MQEEKKRAVAERLPSERTGDLPAAFYSIHLPITSKYSQDRIVGLGLFTAKYNQIYGRPNYLAYSKNGVWPKKKLSKTCPNKGL